MQNNFELMAALEERVEALGSDATESQCERLVEWVIDNIPFYFWADAAETVLVMDGPTSVYSSLRERVGEMGI